MNEARGEVLLPPGTVDLHSELVPALRSRLQRGLSESFMRACVRIGEFEPFSGGLKADLVGGVTLEVRAVIKLGGPELRQHARLMNCANRVRPGTCVEVVDLAELEGERWLMMMSRVQAVTLYDAVYREATEPSILERAVRKVFEGLAAMHAVPWNPADGFALTPDPFSRRIGPKLVDQWPALGEQAALMRSKPGRIVIDSAVFECPPLDGLLQDLSAWLDLHMSAAQPGLVHGDPHLRNAMITRHGRGIAVRFIDPNPEYGYTDPMYDYGKLLHFAEPVGWALLEADRSPCRAELVTDGDGWQLSAHLVNAARATEERRAWLQECIDQRLVALCAAEGGTASARLAVARASAHLGLLARMQAADEMPRRLFVLAHALAALTQWNQEAHEGFAGRGPGRSRSER